MENIKSGAKPLEKALRHKFVIISFSVVFLVLSCIFLVVNGFNYLQVEWKAEALMEIIAENDGIFPSPTNREYGENPPNPVGNQPPNNPRDENFFPEMAPRIHEESFYTTRFFTVTFADSGRMIQTDTSKINRIHPQEAESLGNQVFLNQQKTGTIDLYHYQTFSLPSGETMLVFLDISQDFYFFQTFFLSSTVIFLIALVCMFLLLWLLSQKAVAPIVETYARQKAFITDMSHELKTPLAILKANTEVMELEQGESTWSQSNHKQISKLNCLIVRLLSLAKLEEEEQELATERFSLTNLLEESSENFRILAEKDEKTLVSSLQKDISFQGDLAGITHMMDILLENAVKYCPSQSTITLSLKQEKHYISITVTNPGKNLKKGSYDHWFQRFYREEHSRNSETGGFGLGLSMAKRLAKQHGGKISAHSPDGKVVTLKIEFKI